MAPGLTAGARFLRRTSPRTLLAAAVWAALACHVAHAQPSPSPNPYAAAVLTLGPTLYLPLDEASGPIYDRSRNGFVGTPSGAPGYRRPSLLPNGAGYAVRLSNSASRFAFPGFNKWAGAGYTTVAWVRVLATSTTSRYAQLWGDGLADYAYFMMQYLEATSIGSGVFCVRPHYSDALNGHAPSPCDIGATFRKGQATFIAISWDAYAGETTVIVNDRVWVQTGKPTSAPHVSVRSLPLWIGADNREPAADIELDEVAYFTVPLTAGDLLALYALAQPSRSPTPSPGASAAAGNSLDGGAATAAAIGGGVGGGVALVVACATAAFLVVRSRREQRSRLSRSAPPPLPPQDAAWASAPEMA